MCLETVENIYNWVGSERLKKSISNTIKICISFNNLGP